MPCYNRSRIARDPMSWVSERVLTRSKIEVAVRDTCASFGQSFQLVHSLFQSRQPNDLSVKSV